MRYRLTFIAGVALGYVLGTRAGRERYEQLKKSARRFAENPAVRNAAESAAHSGRDFAARRTTRSATRSGTTCPPPSPSGSGRCGTAAAATGWRTTGGRPTPEPGGARCEFRDGPPVRQNLCMGIVAGLDSSSAFTHIVVCDTDSGAVLREGYAAHPVEAKAAEVDPQAWLLSLGEAASGGLLEGVQAIGVSAQQHGLVPPGPAGQSRTPRPARQRPAGAGRRSRSHRLARRAAGLGRGRRGRAERRTAGREAAVAEADRAGERPAGGRRAPAARLARVAAARLTARRTTDRGAASGTGYWSA